MSSFPFRFLFAATAATVACLLLTAIAVPAAAQQGAQRGALHGACQQDIALHCPNVPAGKGRILTCLIGARGVLSDDCELAVGILEKGFQQSRACMQAFRQVCGTVQPGEGRMRACYQSNQASLGDVCQRPHRTQ